MDSLCGGRHILAIKKESGNRHNAFAVVVEKDEEIVGQ